MFVLPIKTVLFILTVFSECTSASEVNGANRIIGGEPCSKRTDIKKTAFVVSLRVFEKEDKYYRHVCGGSLLKANWILTAANCLTKQQLYAVQASKVKSWNYTGWAARVYKQLHHPSYDMNKVQYDIGLAIILHPINLNTASDYVQLPPKKLEDNYMSALTHCDRTLTVMGFGVVTKKPPYQLSDELMCGDITLMHYPACKGLLQEYAHSKNEGEKPIIYPGHICADPYTPAFSIGDTGAPAMCDNVQYGIASWGTGGKAKWPALLTRVDFFLDDFINPITKSSHSNSNKNNIVILLVCFFLLLH